MSILDTISADLRSIIATIVIKYEKTARENETVDSQRAADMYVSAIKMEDTFRTHVRFSLEAITNSGIVGQFAINCVTDKNNIPENKRDQVVLEERKIIIRDYVEQNNYYRMLSGLPDLTDLLYVYVDPVVCSELLLDPAKPIHLYKKEEIVKLDKSNELTKIIAAHPSKKYLTFLGEYAVDITTARISKNFAILRITKNISESFYAKFNDIYEQCREYFMSVLYNRVYGSQYDLYDNFMALMVVVMTIQRIVANEFKNGIEYDFYDLGSIQLIFNSYNVPFIENLDIEYQRILVRNLNALLRYKSTDKVLYDICSLLGYERMRIFKYFLIKQHKLDYSQNPIFVYKTITNPDGTTSQVEDSQAMYNLYFQAVELNERNVALALTDNINVLDYNQVVIDDPFWWQDDDELVSAVYDSEYNYVETKFLSMNIQYRLTQMMFEISYVFRMLIDKKSELTNINVQLPKMFDSNNINLFNLTALLCALISKKNGFVGNIIYTPTKTLDVLGFNFNADFATIRNTIINDPKLDNALLQYIQNTRVFLPEDVNNLYANIRDLNDFLVNKMSLAKTLEEYRAYKKLFDALMITQHQTALFKKKNGTVANTFLEYLLDTDPILGIFVQNATVDQISGYIDHILYRLNLLVSNLKYLTILNDSNSVVLNAVITLVRFFKSYTTDLASFNVIYLMESRHYNMIKLLNDIKFIGTNQTLYDTSMIMNYNDYLQMSVTMHSKDKMIPIARLANSTNMKLKDRSISSKMRDKLRIQWQI